MTLRNLLTVSAIIGLIFGLGDVLAPTQLAEVYGVSLNAGGAYNGQLFGAALLGFVALNWLARDITDTRALRAIVLANLVSLGLGFIVSLIGQISGEAGANALGWSTVAIYLLLGLGFGYFQFMPQAAAQT